MKNIKLAVVALSLFGISTSLTACNSKQKVVIYTSTEDYNIEYLQKCLDEQFLNYNVVIEYNSTSNIAAKVIEEGSSSECDIVFGEEYGYLEKMIKAGVLDSIKGDYDLSKYTDDTVPASVLLQSEDSSLLYNQNFRESFCFPVF